MTYYVRTAVDPETLLRTIPGVIARLDPTLPVDNLKTMPVTGARERVFDRMISMLSVAFAALTAVLAAVGLVRRARVLGRSAHREIGVRRPRRRLTAPRPGHGAPAGGGAVAAVAA